ncbi:hypothetical protein TUM18999_34220 [Pseudomonas tohonis]|uniref:DUF1652 domain-containing protein n=1 Tax=Pseudomonas tohonis TaxID=2725477 RepID=A0A6J4E9M6_9PSED|nr:DUF1652 domain-containing protein [Pseudomonas tohonis]BCG25231.1 hypothetical protein TUM18999_34220 [Pseudomonas tohonis]GJN56419.1 hypothetical protein TUM20286_61710 [Pseudomonas tohonis]
MNLTTGDISKLFGIYMPAYSCEASRMADGSVTLQFCSKANRDIVTIPGLPTTQLGSAPAIKKLSKSLSEEFAVAIARKGIRA